MTLRVWRNCINTTDPDTRQEIIAKGSNKLTDYNNRFNAMMDSLASKLEENGFGTDKLQEYRDAYTEVKLKGVKRVLSMLNKEK